jgi:hypothetical protein
VGSFREHVQEEQVTAPKPPTGDHGCLLCNYEEWQHPVVFTLLGVDRYIEHDLMPTSGDAKYDKIKMKIWAEEAVTQTLKPIIKAKSVSIWKRIFRRNK